MYPIYKNNTYKNGVQTITSYTYNGKDLRTKKEVKTSTDGYQPKITNYYYDRQHVILETDETGNTITSYIRGNNYIARVDNNEKISYYLYNGHGDVVQTVSPSGQIENQYDYDIFGNPILTIEQGYTNAIRYAGEFYDSETGLYYLRARYYNPYTGRFISEDSYWGEDTNPLSLNLYTYCHNDPINFIDPSGHMELGDEKLTVEAQKEIKALTDAYWATEDEDEKQKIHEEANDIRYNEDNYVGYDNGDSFTKEVMEALSNSGSGYMTGDDWEKTSKKNNRRSKGKRSPRRKTEDFSKYIDKILDEAKSYSDYNIGSENYIEEVSKINKTSGEFKTMEYIMEDVDKHEEEYERVKYNKNETFFMNFINKVNELVSEIKPYEGKIYSSKMVLEPGTRTYKKIWIYEGNDYSVFEKIHYFRIKLNKAPETLEDLIKENEVSRAQGLGDKWILLSPGKSAFHMTGKDGEYNVKFVSADGHFEAVYDKDGKGLTEKNDKINLGTYNFFGPDNADKHVTYDVNPYYQFNSFEDQKGNGRKEELIRAGDNLIKYFINFDAIQKYSEVFKRTNPYRYYRLDHINNY